MNKGTTVAILRAIGMGVGNIVAPGSVSLALGIIDTVRGQIAKSSAPTFAELIKTVEDLDIPDFDDLIGWDEPEAGNNESGENG